MPLIRFIASYYRRAPLRMLIGFLMLVLVDLAQLMSPRIVQKAIDYIISAEGGSEKLIYFSLAIFGIAAGIGIFRFLWRMTIIGMSHFIELDFKTKLFDHLLKLSSSFFNRTKTGDIMAHMTNDMNAVRMSTAFGMIAGFDATFMFIATLVFMTRMNLRLTMFAMIPLPLISLIALFFMRLLYRKFKSVQEAFSNMTDKVQEMYSGIKIIQAFQQEDAESGNFNEISKDYVNKNISLIMIWGTMFPMIHLLAQVGVGIVLLVGGQQVILNQLSPGELVAFISYLGIIVWPMMAVGWVTNIFQRGAASYKRITTFLEEKPDIFDKPGAKAHVPDGNIEFNNVGFAYKEGNVLEDINIKIDKGSYIGICGKIGSGKSTIAKLIMKVILPTSGNIMLDNMNADMIKIDSVRDGIGYVPQDSFLFSATIEENVRFGRPEATLEEIQEVCRIAAVHDNISELKHGYDTIVGEKGVTLSGGQKQRICIARAIIRKPPILILDDALSAVDTNTEKEIIRNLKKYSKGITTIVISHRISSFMNADNIFVLDDGKLSASGKHNELIETSDIYRNIYEIQKLEE